MINRKFENKEEYQDGKYKFFTISNGEKNYRRVLCETEGICLIPFDINDSNNIKNVYLARYTDYLNGEEGHCCLTCESVPNHDSDFEEISEFINSELGINPEINDVYFLGRIQHQLPFSKTYKCYAIDLTQYSKDPTGFKIDVPDEESKNRTYSLDKVNFNRVFKGDVEDSLCLSASMLLISYIN